jgi:hypothetical protein
MSSLTFPVVGTGVDPVTSRFSDWNEASGDRERRTVPCHGVPQLEFAPFRATNSDQ